MKDNRTAFTLEKHWLLALSVESTQLNPMAVASTKKSRFFPHLCSCGEDLYTDGVSNRMSSPSSLSSLSLSLSLISQGPKKRSCCDGYKGWGPSVSSTAFNNYRGREESSPFALYLSMFSLSANSLLRPWTSIALDRPDQKKCAVHISDPNII